jgi:ComF family protein
MKLMTEDRLDFDLLTWIPISAQRLRKRGYDQVELLAQKVARELNRPLVPTLKKIRHNQPQSGIVGAAERRANVLGAYSILDGADVAGKRILLLDDILTTGATASECSRVLLTAGAAEVQFAAVAGANQNHNR